MGTNNYICISRYDIDGNHITVLTCRVCGNQINEKDVPRPKPNTLLEADADRFMQGKCCETPVYFYDTPIWFPEDEGKPNRVEGFCIYEGNERIEEYQSMASSSLSCL